MSQLRLRWENKDFSSCGQPQAEQRKGAVSIRMMADLPLFFAFAVFQGQHMKCYKDSKWKHQLASEEEATRQQ
jgi:hypothetical protein